MSSTELMTAAQFLQGASVEARFFRQPDVDDALSKAVIEIEMNPFLAQSRLLTRILSALAGAEGEFRRADLNLLSVKALATIDSLIKGLEAGRYSRDDCRRAADRVERAQRVIDG